MAWIYLVLAGLFEIGWAIGLKYTHGFTRLVPSLLTVASMIVSLGLLGHCLADAAGRNRLRGLDRASARSGRRSSALCFSPNPPPWCAWGASRSSWPESWA